VAPDRVAGRGWDLVQVEKPADLADRVAPGQVVIEDTTHDSRFRFEDLEVRGDLSDPRDPPVAVGRLPCDDLTPTRSPQLAAAVTLSDLRLLVLGDHPLDLCEEPSLRIVVEARGIGEQQCALKAFELVEHEHLVCVGTGESVW